jgi:hypothetical protein
MCLKNYQNINGERKNSRIYEEIKCVLKPENNPKSLKRKYRWKDSDSYEKYRLLALSERLQIISHI